MEDVKVTVVTITYNLIKSGREKYVRQAIDCVFNQTYKNIEHIIIDGASDDGTLDIFKDYPHLKVFSEPDSGVYDAMNKGVKHANGKYIVFLNSDDFWHDNQAVEVSVKALEENNADFSYAPCNHLDKDDNFIGYLYPTVETFFAWMPFCHQTMFTRTELVKFNTKYKSAGDFDFILNLILNGAKGVYVPLNFTSYRWMGLSSGTTDEYGNSGGSLSGRECMASIRYHLSTRYGTTQRSADGINNFKSIKRDLLEKIVNDIDPALANIIKKSLLTQRTKNIDIDMNPIFRMIQVLFNARDLKYVEGAELARQLLKHDDCSLLLYVEPKVEIPDEFKDLPVYEGRMVRIDAFCSPVSSVPRKIKKSNIPILTSANELSYRYTLDVDNIFITGKYKIKVGNFTLFKVKVNHGITIYKLFKFIPVWKIVVSDGSEKHYMFTFLKVLELKN